MAAAILMMNMQGAVMAADKDLTIFRYSDKVSFALMTDPKSPLPWEDIWNEFRISTDVIDNYVSEFINYLRKALLQYVRFTLNENLFCISYDTDAIFPHAEHLIIKTDGVDISVDLGTASAVITPQTAVYYNWLGDFVHMGSLLGENLFSIENVIRPEYSQIVDDFKNYLLQTTDDEAQRDKIESYLSLIDFDQKYMDVFSSVAKEQQKKLEDAISSYHIEDMVRMSEHLIDAEGQFSNLENNSKQIACTREIATMTLAEGFRWIKHSLYGA